MLKKKEIEQLKRYREKEEEWLSTKRYPTSKYSNTNEACDYYHFGAERGNLGIEHMSNYYVSCALAYALYAYNDGFKSSAKSVINDLSKIMPKELVENYVYGGKEFEDDSLTINFKYTEEEFVNKFRKNNVIKKDKGER